MTRVMGLDVALGATGVARIDGTFATVKSPARLKNYDRHAHVRDGIVELVIADAPDVVILEDYAPRSIGILATIRAAEIGGLVRTYLTESGRPWLAVKPNTLKLYATGKGNAKKPAMADAANADIPALRMRPGNFDEVDAYWLRSMGSAWYDDGGVFGPGLEHRTKAIEAVDWLELEP